MVYFFQTPINRMNDEANLIVPRLWLGNRFAAANQKFLNDNNITVVFNCTKDLPFSPVVQHRYRVPVHDNLEAEEINNLEKWAPEIVYKVVSEYNKGNNILIHCHAGMQRSAAVMAMTLIALTGHSFDEIRTYIRNKRPIAFFPATNFEKSIRGFENVWKNT